MNQAYKAANGEILIALNEVQADAFEKAGMEKVEDKPKKPKVDE